MYEETDFYERIRYHARIWSFLRPVFCPQFYIENGRFLEALENNNSRSRCSLNEEILLWLSITSLSCISGVKAKRHEMEISNYRHPPFVVKSCKFPHFTTALGVRIAT